VKPRIVILGAGYAGLAATTRLAGRLRTSEAQITLVNAADHFVERIRLHQVATGQQVRTHSLAEILSGTGVEIVVDRVIGIDAAARTVALVDGQNVPYDVLLYALGSGPDLDSVPGVREHALAVAAPAAADQLHDALIRIEHGSVVVVGGGLTGIETAAEIAERRPDLTVRLVTAGAPGGWLSASAQRHLYDGFGRLGIYVRDHCQVKAVTANGLDLEDGPLDATAVVWAAGFSVPGIARDAGIEVDGAGRMVVDAWLRSVSHPAIYGAGDAVAAGVHGKESRMSCQTGLPMGVRVADVIARRLTGRTARPVRIRYVWQNISLGRRDGVTQFTRADDSPVRAILTGRTSARFKELISRFAGLATRHAGAVTRTYRPPA
jgi:NADH:ubiquinone reductase (H+-translocating)